MRETLHKDIKPSALIPDIILPEDFVTGDGQLGARVSMPVLMDDGQWDSVVPPAENQLRNGLETMNCTNFNTLTPLEAIMRRNFGVTQDYSERYTGVLTGTTKNGNSPQKVIEEIRKNIGLVPEEMLPFGDDIRAWGQYYSPNPMSRALVAEGRKFLKQYEIGHEWVFEKGVDAVERQGRMMDMLRYSPLGVSVVAWQQGVDGLYFKEPHEDDNHWTAIIGYERGKYWKCRDSYDGDKQLEWGYTFGMAKRYSIARKPKEPSFCERFRSIFMRPDYSLTPAIV